MAITPRTIFSSAAPATVAAVSLLAFSAVGTVVYMSAQTQHQPARGANAAHGQPNFCKNLRRALGPEESTWSEADWIRYASCLERHDHPVLTVEAASKGLAHYPSSESLYNIKGYHQITIEDYDGAVETLRTGLERVGEPYSGILENNLAWAGLWAPREMEVDRARELYQSALDKEPNVCAYLHTGIWVEYAKARRSSGVERYQAMKKFDGLRKRYEPCLARAEGGEWKTVVEVAGAGALYAQLQADGELATDGKSGDAVLSNVADVLAEEYPEKTAEDVCRDAMPFASTQHACERQLGEAMDSTKVEAAPKRPEPCGY